MFKGEVQNAKENEDEVRASSQTLRTSRSQSLSVFGYNDTGVVADYSQVIFEGGHNWQRGRIPYHTKIPEDPPMPLVHPAVQEDQRAQAGGISFHLGVSNELVCAFKLVFSTPFLGI